MGKWQSDAARCPVTWDPEEWPYATRCNSARGHVWRGGMPVHRDHRGRTYNTRTQTKTKPQKEATDDE